MFEIIITCFIGHSVNEIIYVFFFFYDKMYKSDDRRDRQDNIIGTHVYNIINCNSKATCFLMADC